MINLKDVRVLVTGGAGFVGSFVAEGLLKEGVREIIILDNLVRGSESNIRAAMASQKTRFIKGDIRDKGLVAELSAGIDYCFHLAALRITHCASDPREAFEVMYGGTFNVLEACVEQKIKKVIFASSASIYGQADSFPTPEKHHPYNNITLYGAAKMAAELMLRSFYQMYGLDYVVLRYFNIYGPRMDIYGKYTEVLIKWYHLIKDGKRPVIYGDGKQTMDFIFVEDVARATIMACKSKASNEVFNIGSGVETSLKELCLSLLKVMGSNLKPEYLSVSDERKKVEVKRRLADISTARKIIGFKSRLTLTEGLERLTGWLNEQEGNKP